MTDKGFRCLVAPFEADAQLTFLMAMKKISAVITEDSDLLVYGCDTIIFKLNNQTGQGVQVKSRDLVKIPGFQGWTHERFRHMCILSGCDYLPSLPSIGIKVAKRMLTAHEDIEKHLQYLQRIGRTKNRPTYADDFHKANETFLYQTVYDPDRNVVVPLNVPPNIIECLDSIKANIPKHTRDIIQARKSSTRITNSKDKDDDSVSDTKEDMPRKEFVDTVSWLEANKENLPPGWGIKYIKETSKPRANRDTRTARAITSSNELFLRFNSSNKKRKSPAVQEASPRKRRAFGNENCK